MLRIRWFVTGLWAAAVLAGADLASAQQGTLSGVPRLLNQRAESVARLEQWAAAVMQHAPGRLDPPATVASSWTPPQLADLDIEFVNLLVLMDNPNARTFAAEDRQFRSSDVLYRTGELTRMRQLAIALGGRDPLNRDRDAKEDARVAAARMRLLKRAAILHTDVARLVDRTPQTPTAGAASAARGTVHFYDGEVIGIDSAGDHWEFARRLLDRVKPGQTHDPDVLLWYRATLAWMLGTVQLQWPHFERAQQLYPDDPYLLYLRGYLHETLASPRVQNVAAAITSSGRSSRIRAPRAELRDAESYLRRALAADPQLIDAHLRLGHVLTLIGNDAAAVTELQAVLKASQDSSQLYFANLFLGSALESLGRRNEAREAYTRAAGHVATADAPQLALSQLALRAGNAADAYTVLETALQRQASDPDDDPWWTYPNAIHASTTGLLEAAYTGLLGRAQP